MFCVIAQTSLKLVGSWTGNRETGWSQITYVANRDSLRFRSRSLSGRLGEDSGGENVMMTSAQAFVEV